MLPLAFKYLLLCFGIFLFGPTDPLLFMILLVQNIWRQNCGRLNLIRVYALSSALFRGLWFGCAGYLLDLRRIHHPNIGFAAKYGWLWPFQLVLVDWGCHVIQVLLRMLQRSSKPRCLRLSPTSLIEFLSTFARCYCWTGSLRGGSTTLHLKCLFFRWMLSKHAINTTRWLLNQ